MTNRIIKNWDSLPIVLQIPDVSAVLGCSDDQARKLCRAGVIPAKKVSYKLWAIPKDGLKKYVEGDS